MPFKANAVLEANGKKSIVSTLFYSSKLQFLTDHQGKSFSCPGCGSPFCVKSLHQNNRVFFAHLPDKDNKDKQCDYSKRSTKEHDECKAVLAQLLLDQKILRSQIHEELWFGKDRCADMCLTNKKNKKTVVFEVQLSPMSDELFLERTRFYHNQTIDCIWLFKENSRKTQRLEDICKNKFGYLYRLFKTDKDGVVTVEPESFKSFWQDRIGDIDNYNYWSHYDFVNWETENWIEEQKILNPSKIQPINHLKASFSEQLSDNYSNFTHKKREFPKYHNSITLFNTEKTKHSNVPPTSLGQYIPSRYPEKVYRVNSYGRIFPQCKPLGIIKTAIGIYYHFESIDHFTKGEQFYCFRKEDFTEIS